MFFRSKKPPRWPVIQIEVSSDCSMHCIFCPSKLLGKAWQCGELPWEIYRDHIAPHLERFALVYLQGWGEPLAHPRLWDMVALARAAGCRTGFTSCGALLTAENIDRLLDTGVDILSVSFAGATPPVQESLRVGSDFDRLVSSLEALAARRAQRRGRLHLELHFLMMRSNLHELPAFIRLAAALGADEAVATNLSYTATPELDGLRVFGPQPDPAHLAWVAKAAAEAERLGLRFRPYPLVVEGTVSECDARPTEMVFVNRFGAVTPCVYLGMPIAAPVPRYFYGENWPMPPVSFGDVRDGLLEVIEGPRRKAFCDAFQKRKSSARAALLFVATAGEQPPPHEPPEPCRHCYKLFGI